MALILHCDACHAQDGSLDGNVVPGVEYMGAPVPTNCAPQRITVTRDTQIFGMKKDLCNRCIAKINGVLQIPIDTPAIPEERRVPIVQGGRTIEPRFDHQPLAGSH